MQLADHIRKARQIQNKLSHPSCAAVIVAAGSSARMGGTDKLLAELGGLPVLSRTLRVFDDHEMIDTIIVVAREDRMPKISRVCSPYRKVRIVVPGGESRQESVMHGLKAVPEGTELVAVHDGARPLVSDKVITDAVRAATESGAAAPVVPVKDSIKRIENGKIAADVPRDTLAAVQTPQVFRRELLLDALQSAAASGRSFTDDCAAVEALGQTVSATEGSYENIKVTTPEDILVAEAFMHREAAE